MSQIPVFIGLDKREAVLWHVCAQSILDNTNHPDRISFHAVTGEQRDGSNTFTYARFLVPHRMGYKGHALWLDGDMVLRGDIEELWEQRANGYTGVQVVQHDYRTRFPSKYLGNRNEDYARKNWSSVILWNCHFYPNRILTPEFVARAPGDYLHRFQWLRDDQIRGLPAAWNRLVLEQEIDPEDRLLHYTIGAPCFAEYADCPGAQDWHDTYQRMVMPYVVRHLHDVEDRDCAVAGPAQRFNQRDRDDDRSVRELGESEPARAADGR